MSEPRFSVEPGDGWTECECPESLCTHQPSGMRSYDCWIIWDNERRDHAFLTMPDVENEYLRKRDAIAVADRLNEPDGES